MRSLRSILLLALISLFIAPPLYGANSCVAVRGIAQQHLLDLAGGPGSDYFPLRIDPDRGPDPWVGPVQLLLGSNEILIGKVSEYDGVTGPSQGTGQGKDGSFLFDFGVHGSFVVHYGNAVWPTQPSFVLAAIPTYFTGTFHANGSVDPASGTGRFAGATGNLAAGGPFIAWNVYPPDYPDPPLPFGRFSNEITGSLCGVGPKTVADIKPAHMAPRSPVRHNLANDASQGCQAYHLAEFFDAATGTGTVNVTLGSKPLHPSNVIGEALNFVKQVGNATFGNEKLRFLFEEGSFLLDASFETIADPLVMARVNGRGQVMEGTGVFKDATGSLTYHGPFANDTTGTFTYLDIDYRGQMCPARAQ